VTTESELVFDPFSDEFYADPYTLFRRLRDETPVYYNEDLDFYALTRHEDVATAYKDFKTYSSTAGLDLAMVKSGQEAPKMIVFMDPPEHGRMRGLLNKAFTPRAIQSQRATVTELVERCLSMVDPRHFDAVQQFAAPLAMDVVARMAGVPEQFAQQVRLWTDQAIGYQPGQLERDWVDMEAALNILSGYNDLVQQRREQPNDDMISKLTAAQIIRDDGEITRLEDHEIALFAVLLSAAGAQTVTRMLGNAVAVFAEHTDQWQKLADDRSKIPGAVEELLRFDGPVLYNVRCTLREVTLHGVTIPAGKPVFLCGASANRDPDAFTDPDTFDIDRDLTQAQHIALGYGVHTCLGAQLARMEIAIAVEHLLDFMPRYEVIWQDCKRVNATNLAGWSHLPVRVMS
jgi:cytochrome P450